MRIKFTQRIGNGFEGETARSYTLHDYITNDYPLIKVVSGDPLTMFAIPDERNEAVYADLIDGKVSFRQNTRVVSPYEVTGGRHPSQTGIITVNLVSWEVLDDIWDGLPVSFHYRATMPDDWDAAKAPRSWYCVRGTHDKCEDNQDAPMCCCTCH